MVKQHTLIQAIILNLSRIVLLHDPTNNYQYYKYLNKVIINRPVKMIIDPSLAQKNSLL